MAKNNNTMMIVGIFVVLFLFMTGIFAGLFYLFSNNFDNLGEDETSYTTDSTVEPSTYTEQLIDLNESILDIETEQDNTSYDVSKTIPGVGQFVIDSTTQGVIWIEDKSPSVAKTVTLDDEEITFNSNNYYAAVMNAGTYLIRSTPDDTNTYQNYAAMLSVNAGCVNQDSGSSVTIYKIQNDEYSSTADDLGDDVSSTSVGDEDTITYEDQPIVSDTSAGAARLYVIVTDDAGAAIEGASVTVYPNSDGGSTTRTTGSTGKTTYFAVLAGADITISVVSPDDTHQSTKVVISDLNKDATYTETVVLPTIARPEYTEFRVKALTTTPYSAGVNCIVQDEPITITCYGTSSADGLIYDKKNNKYVSSITLNTDDTGATEAGRIYVPKTGYAVIIQPTTTWSYAQGIKRTIDASTDKSKYTTWLCYFAPYKVDVTFNINYVRGYNSYGLYKWWVISPSLVKTSLVSSHFDSANLAAVYGLLTSSDANLYFADEDMLYTYVRRLSYSNDMDSEYATNVNFGTVSHTFTRPALGQSKYIYSKVDYTSSVVSENANDIRKYQLTTGSTGHVTCKSIGYI